MTHNQPTRRKETRKVPDEHKAPDTPEEFEDGETREAGNLPPNWEPVEGRRDVGTEPEEEQDQR